MPSPNDRQYVYQQYGEFRVRLPAGAYSVQDLADILAAALKLKEESRQVLESPPKET